MSKSAKEFLEEIKFNDELKKELANALMEKSPAVIEDFMKKHDCNASYEEAKEVLKEEAKIAQSNGELTAEELESAAGGATVEWVITTLVSAITAICTIDLNVDFCD